MPGRFLLDDLQRRRAQSAAGRVERAVEGAVIAGIGIAIVSRLAIGCELQFGSLAIIPVKDLAIRRPLHLQRMRGKNQSPALAQFLNILASWKNQPTKASH